MLYHIKWWLLYIELFFLKVTKIGGVRVRGKVVIKNFTGNQIAFI